MGPLLQRQHTRHLCVLLVLTLLWGLPRRAQALGPLRSQGRPAWQSSGGYPVNRANDGNTATDWGSNSCIHSDHGSGHWWRVDLQHSYEIEEVHAWVRSDCCHNRDYNHYVQIGEYSDCYSHYQRCGDMHWGTVSSGSQTTVNCKRGYGHEVGRYVSVAQWLHGG